MESIQNIKSRLRAVQNIGQITKAMEVVSATKMRKAQSVALASRPFSFAALSALADLLHYAPEEHVESAALVQSREVKNTLLVLVASDRGLAGAFNAQVMRSADSYISANAGNYRLVLVGKKLASYATRRGLPVEMMYTDFGDYASPEEVAPLTELIMKGYLGGNWDKVVVISTHFKTTLNQFTITREILPMQIEQIKETVREIVPEHGKFSEYREQVNNELGIRNYKKNTEFIFEPSAKEVLEQILPHLLHMQVLHLVLEANASEHSARMVSMKNASENSQELSDSLNLSFNKARQTLITKEMIEISSAIV